MYGLPCRNRIVPLLLCLPAVLVAGCGDDGGSEVPGSKPIFAEFGKDEWSTDFSKHSVPLDEIVSGGPPKDGIPAIDEPRFVSVPEADDWLEDREPVIALEHGGEAKAYPYRILMFHEIVNDSIAGLPAAVTYCPLCNTAIVFDRRAAGRVLDFGTTGRLRHSDLVMYDRQTESWWQQALGEAIVGELTGTELEWLPSQTLSWREFRQAHPEGRVLSRDTGFRRSYGTNPYGGYDSQRGPIRTFFQGSADDRLPAMERVAGVELGDERVAYPFSLLREERVVNDEVGGEPVVVFWAPGTASALDAADITQGRDVGSSGVFHRRIDGRTLTFEPADDGFRDRETESRWSIQGAAVAGPLAGSRLERVPFADFLWFAWARFAPDTRIAGL